MKDLEPIRGGLIVSCQPVPGSPLDDTKSIVAMAQAAQAGGARALRIEGTANVAAVVAACGLPVVGIVKRDLDEFPIRITPFSEDVRHLAEAGAHIIAVDATSRRRPVPIAELLSEIRRAGRFAMADLSCVAEAENARALGFDIIGTTLSGYTGGPVPEGPDLGLVADCWRLGGLVVAEGRYNDTHAVARAIQAGASAVCVGSALTRLEHATSWFASAIADAGPQESVGLAFDIGGTKTAAALVRGGDLLDRVEVRTPPKVGTAGWFDRVTGLANAWRGRYDYAGCAVTGIVEGGLWSALNPGTLDIPGQTPLRAELESRLGLPVATLNDAQASAWGEYAWGAGRGRDMAFVTASSGVGGGVVLDGRLRHGAGGFAGSLGQWRGVPAGSRLEDRASGFAVASAAFASGREADSRLVFAAADVGDEWALRIIDDATRAMATALVDLQLLLDPETVVLGGGIGLLPRFRASLETFLEDAPARLRPDLRAAELGADGGLVGAADYGRRKSRR